MRKRGSNTEIVMLRSRQADPIRVVDLCIAKMRELEIDTDEGDLAICAFDVDENPVERIQSAVHAAEEKKVQVAISNPCFELWLLLHFREVNHRIRAGEAREMLSEHIEDYSKTADYRHILDSRRESALERSAKLQQSMGIMRSLDFAEHNPSTGMHIAVRAINDLVQRNQRS